MELIKDTVRIRECVLRGTTQCMCDGDVVVPDIKPDMLKILQVDAVSCITNKTVTSGRGDIEGRVDLTVLYIPDTDRERIKSITASFDFAHHIDNAKINDDMKLICEGNVERVEFTPVNSRKLRLRVITQLAYEIADLREKELIVDTEDGCAEVKKEAVTIQNAVDLFETSFSVHDTMEIQNGQHSINEILKIDTVIGDCEYKAVMGKIVAKGVVNVCVLYTDESDGIEFCESEFTFTEVFDSPNCSDADICSIDYEVKSFSAQPCADNDGDIRMIDVEMMIGACVDIKNEAQKEIICDCYEPGMKTTLIREDETVEECVSRPGANYTIREIVPFPDSTPGVAAVYNVITKPNVKKTQIANGKLSVEGVLDTYILYICESSESPVYSLKKEIPFAYALDCESGEEGLDAAVKVGLKHSSYSLNVANELELRCILSVSAQVIRKRDISLICAAECEEKEEKSGIVIYFVRGGDTLWDISKHYAVSMKAVEEFNNIENGKLKQGERLFIPV